MSRTAGIRQFFAAILITVCLTVSDLTLDWAHSLERWEKGESK